jgi:hypothetical protein
MQREGSPNTGKEQAINLFLGSRMSFWFQLKDSSEKKSLNGLHFVPLPRVETEGRKGAIRNICIQFILEW